MKSLFLFLLIFLSSFIITLEKENETITSTITKNQTEIKDPNKTTKNSSQQEENSENHNINNNNLIDDIDEVPIMVNKNQNQLIEEINIEDEPIQIPKKLSMDEFNKKIDSALEQEQEHQDKISKEKTENNLKEKSNKKKGREYCN